MYKAYFMRLFLALIVGSVAVGIPAKDNQSEDKEIQEVVSSTLTRKQKIERIKGILIKRQPALQMMLNDSNYAQMLEKNIAMIVDGEATERVDTFSGSDFALDNTKLQKSTVQKDTELYESMVIALQRDREKSVQDEKRLKYQLLEQKKRDKEMRRNRVDQSVLRIIDADKRKQLARSSKYSVKKIYPGMNTINGYKLLTENGFELDGLPKKNIITLKKEYENNGFEITEIVSLKLNAFATAFVKDVDYVVRGRFLNGKTKEVHPSLRRDKVMSGLIAKNGLPVGFDVYFKKERERLISEQNKSLKKAWNKGSDEKKRIRKYYESVINKGEFSTDKRCQFGNYEKIVFGGCLVKMLSRNKIDVSRDKDGFARINKSCNVWASEGDVLFFCERKGRAHIQIYSELVKLELNKIEENKRRNQSEMQLEL